MKPTRDYLKFGRITAIQIATVGALLAAWELLAATKLFYKGAVPSFGKIVQALGSFIVSERFWSNLSTSLFEITLALLIGCFVGLAAGIVVGANNFMRAALEPYLNYLASTPKVILFPIFLIAFGVGVASKIALAAVACLFPMLLSTIGGMRQINRTHVRVGRVFNMSSFQMVRMIYLPSLVNPILTGIKISLGVAIVVCLLGEIKFSNKGLGFMVAESYQRSRFSDLYAMLIVVFVIAIAGNSAVDHLSQRLSFGPSSKQ